MNSPLQRIELRFTLPLLAIALAVISGGRLLGPGRDFAGYTTMFQWARDVRGLYEITSFPPHDLGFAALLYLLANTSSLPDMAIFFLLGVVTIYIKLLCYAKYSPSLPVAFLTYLAFLFVVPDYTQLRAGLALAFMYLAAVFLLVTKQRVQGLALGGLAATVHLSSITLVPFLVAIRTSMKAVFVGGMIALLAGFALDLLSPLLVGHLPPTRLSAQLTVGKALLPPNPLSSIKVFEYLSLGLFFHYLSEIRARRWILVEASGWLLVSGLAFFFGLFAMPEFAHRISQLFEGFLPFLVAGLSALMPRKFAIPYVSLGLVIGCWSSFRLLS